MLQDDDELRRSTVFSDDTCIKAEYCREMYWQSQKLNLGHIGKIATFLNTKNILTFCLPNVTSR